MSFKAKIMILVVLFVVVVLLVGFSGNIAIKMEKEALLRTNEATTNYNTLQNIAFEMETVASFAKEMILLDLASEKVKLRDEIVRSIQEELAPSIAGYNPKPEIVDQWNLLISTWNDFQDSIKVVIDNSMANTGYYARRLSLDASLVYWNEYVDYFNKMIENAAYVDHYQIQDLIFEAQGCVLKIYALQLYEKLGIQAEDKTIRETYFARAKAELGNITLHLNNIEAIFINPQVNQDVITAFNAEFKKASEGKVQFSGQGSATWHKTPFQLPENFIKPSLRELGTYYYTYIKPLRGGGTDIFDRIRELALQDTNYVALQTLKEKSIPLGHKVDAIIVDLLDESDVGLRIIREETNKTSEMAQTTLYLVTGIGLLLGIVLSLIYTSKLNNSLIKITKELSKISDQVEAATEQLAQSASAQAQGAAEYASSIKQTRVTLDNLSEIISGNLELSNAADEVMRDATKEVNKAGDHVSQVNDAMKEITVSGKEIGKILKVINGIAFQTNLLALNAAVEASRAGEAGAGFAVVAEEVRNLAVRSAEAAKDSEGLISQMINNIDTGKELVMNTAHKMEDTVGEIKKGAAIVTEMHQSSQTQSEFVKDLHETVVEMDSVTQAHSASAEEIAATSYALEQQCHVLRVDMEELTRLAEGKVRERSSRLELD
jgi:methyl-accepting chemotaxis protein